MGNVNKLSVAKLETSNKYENESAATTTGDVAFRVGNNLRPIVIKDSTYNALREFALTYESHPTFDTLIRKLFEAYNKKS